jgi:hypothetical protein
LIPGSIRGKPQARAPDRVGANSQKLFVTDFVLFGMDMLMIEKGNKYILDRETSKQLAQSHFQDSSSLLRELANYGSNLIPRCFLSSGKEVKDIIILGSLLKQFVAMVDGAEILLSEGAQHAASLQIRALFEQHLYMAWMFKDDTDRRARLYYVWNLRKRRYWNNITISGTAENAKFAPHFAELRTSKILSLPPETKKAQIETLLQSTPYASLNAEFDKLKGKKLHDVPWHLPFGGVSSIKKMADHLKFSKEYDISYDQLSGVAHSTAFFKQVAVKNEQITFEPVRELVGVDTHFRSVAAYCLQTYRMVLGHYRHAEIEAFDRKYRDEWRSRFMGIKSVVNTEPIIISM